MEINVTALFNDKPVHDFSGSIAERGANAGPETWANANAEAAESPLLSAGQIAEAKEYFADFGAWEDEEIAAWSDQEVNALVIQYISGDIREAKALCLDDNGEFSWAKHEELSQEGTIAGRLFEGSDGEVYFYLGG